MDNLLYKQSVWNECQKKGKCLIEEGLRFFSKGELERYHCIEVSKEEFVTNARYLHRGYYCPSPVKEFIISNAKRGKLLQHKSKRSKISHRYIYGRDNKLLIVEATLPDGKKKTEYLVYMTDKVYGFSFDDWGTLVGVSEELYKDGILYNYFCASCFNHVADKINFGITSVCYEKYYYNELGLQDVDFYFSNMWCDTVDDLSELDTLLQGGRYHILKGDKGTVLLSPRKTGDGSLS